MVNNTGIIFRSSGKFSAVNAVRHTVQGYGTQTANTNATSVYRDRVTVKCKTPYLSEAEIQTAVLEAWRLLFAEKARYIAEYETEIEALSDNADFDKETALLTVECAEASEAVKECIAQNARSPQNQTEYLNRYDELVERYDQAKARFDRLALDKQKRNIRKEQLIRFTQILRKTEAAPDTFDNKLWRETVEAVTVHTKERFTVRLRSGTEIPVCTKQNSAG